MTTKETYEAYLLSDHWRGLRDEAFKRANNRCETCAAKPRHGHHLIYRTPLESCTADDIMALCERCHNIWHDWLRQRGWKVSVFCRQSTRGGILALINPLGARNEHPKRSERPTKVPRKQKLQSRPLIQGSNAKERFLMGPELAAAIDTMPRDTFKAWLRENVPGKKKGKVMSKAFVLYDRAGRTNRRSEARIIGGVYHT